MSIHHFVADCWGAFIGYWLIAAWGVKAVRAEVRWREQLGHQLLLGLGALLLLDVYAWHGAERLWPASRSIGLAGAAAAGLGLAGAIWSRRALGGNWSSEATIKEGHELVQRGPYRWVRNPIYTSLLLMFLGTGMEKGTVRGLIAFLCCLGALWIKLRQEEGLMLGQFPESYPAYRQRVKALIPFVL